MIYIIDGFMIMMFFQPSMGGMTRRVGTPLGGNQGMMGSGQGSGGGGGTSSQYVMIGGDRGGESNQQGPQGSQGGAGGGGQMGRDGGAQTQQV